MITHRIRAYGIVQGVGFRPTVARHAATTLVTGTVCNKGPYVEIVAQGSEEQVARFEDLLRTQPPRRSSIIKIATKPLGETSDGVPAFGSFSIVESERTDGAIFVSPDIAICDECAAELFDPANRRYLHPFINCTNCGPRLTILDALPYDRERTSMRDFTLCSTCEHEYHDPASRRFDAQPVCCNKCGPVAFLLDRPERGRAAITEARRIIAAGGIVAVKGIGGFHLCCDATNEEAVELLRGRKHRPTKPLAVMAKNIAAAQTACEVSEVARDLLLGHQRPILLLPRHTASPVCEAVAPANPKLGLMLPYAPLQLLLFDYNDGIAMPAYLVMTSANDSGAPICRTDDDARAELAGLADAVLTHNRTIRLRADDTVLDLYHDRPYMVRRSRGWAPLPTQVSALSATDGDTSSATPAATDARQPQVVAVGGELKNAFCLGAGDLFYLSPYVGDLADVRTVRACEEAIERLRTLLELAPAAVACDLHPGYNSTRVARELAERAVVPLVEVQHHYAHVVSCMAENDVAAGQRVIGVALDGTGYGSDGTIWGGEVLLAGYAGFERLSHLDSFALPGGDAAAREGWRPALALLAQHNGNERAAELANELGLCTTAEARMVLAMVERGLNTVATTSAGRLFDAVSAVLGIRRTSSFEGEAATQLQFAAERATSRRAPNVSSTTELFAHIVEGRLAGRPVDELAYEFHAGLARVVDFLCKDAREKTGVSTVALTGGCFQNLLLLDLCVRQLAEADFEVLTHSLVPPNDGGIALGQAVVTAYKMTQNPQWGTGH